MFKLNHIFVLRPEESIADGYLAEECMIFMSNPTTYKTSRGGQNPPLKVKNAAIL